ncbi:MAG TPA: flagellar biosynthesis anti-sigma factor FlgM [Polyangia bacterium]|jgi:anti-sigma28 factor (negative regulator of flagellin synthesis)|nr:flagellar biosynthesis anti-sigma factor FlgM [Polyangia bacterium]
MTLTSGGRLPARSAKDSAQALGAGGADISRQARIEELRQMVAAGRYQVQPEKLALNILVRALTRR